MSGQGLKVPCSYLVSEIGKLAFSQVHERNSFSLSDSDNQRFTYDLPMKLEHFGTCD